MYQSLILQKNASHLIASTFSTLSTARPASNPRANLAWRAVEKVAGPSAFSPSVEGAVTGEGDDVDMEQDEMINAEAGPSRHRSPTTLAEGEKKDDEAPEAPDYQLLSALHSTSQAMEELSKRSAHRAKSSDRDPREELRRIEMQLLGSSMIDIGGTSGDRVARGSRLNAVRTQMAGSTPGSNAMGHTPARQPASSPVAGR